MGVVSYIARRYLISRKSTNVINLISGISVFGILFCTAALIILLSAFNGLESWVVRLYNTFDPDLKVLPVQSKFFEEDSAIVAKLRSLPGVAEVVLVIEENGLVKYHDAQAICAIKGLSDEFNQNTTLKPQLISGSFGISAGSRPIAMIGSGLAYSLSLSLGNINQMLDLYVPRPGISNTLNPAEAFHSASILPTGVFEVQPDYDAKYLLVPINFARELFSREHQLSAIEIKLKQGEDLELVRRQVLALMGNSFVLKDRFEQHEVLYKIINSEKWAVFLIGIFILLIAAFNITGTLTMLIVDKTRDIGTLRSLGLSWLRIRRIFFAEGLLVSLSGLVGGIILGSFIVWIQQMTGLVMINQYDAYPVEFQLADFLLVIVTVSSIGALASWFPSAGVLRRYNLREW